VRASEWVSDYRGSDVTLCDAEEELVEHKKSGKFAKYIAKRAYFQFGVRSQDRAHMLVTRKWIRNLLDNEFTSLRLSDKINILDEALFLSFIPSDVYSECEELASTEYYLEEVPEGTCSK
jgi:hypothetical protein